MINILNKLVEFFMSVKLQEEIEDEIESDQTITAPEDRRAPHIQQISEWWKYQGELVKDVNVRPKQTKF